MERKSYSLSEIALSIQRMFDQHWNKPVLIRAEMNKLNHYPVSGHCYPELVEKKDNKVAAQMKATLWKVHYERINKAFLEIVKEPLKDGMQILFEATVRYSPLHGLSLDITDIDVSYSLGDLEKEKINTIRQLKEEGLFLRNKSVALSALPKRIAIVSVESSKGYRDFMEILDKQKSIFPFFHMLFPAVLQGDKAPLEIIKQLRRIRSVKHHFDAVAIIRGGGGDIGLACYNNYNLCKAICEFPLPIFTGIGHSTNETVTEMVSHTNGITPTDLANQLLAIVEDAARPLEEIQKHLPAVCIDYFSGQHLFLRETAGDIAVGTKRALTKQFLEIAHSANLLASGSRHSLRMWSQRSESLTLRFIQAPRYLLKSALKEVGSLRLQLSSTGTKKILSEKEELHKAENAAVLGLSRIITSSSDNLDKLAMKVELLDPMAVLKRGFSITKVDGKTIGSIKSVEAGQWVETILSDGTIISEVKSKKPDSK